MKLTLVAAAAATVSLALVGCQTITIPPIPIPLLSNVATIEAQVIAECQAICGVLPLTSDIAAVLAAGNPALQTAEAISQAICAAIATTPHHRGVRVRSTVMVGGVVVHLIPVR